MERKEFLSLLGIGSMSVFSTACLGGCSKANAGYSVAVPTGVDFTIDLSLPTNAVLNNSGGYIYSGGIIVAKTTVGGYIAVSQACPHEGVTVQYQGANQRFFCPSHGATFSNIGAVIGGPTNASLKQYNTSLTGSILRVYS